MTHKSCHESPFDPLLRIDIALLLLFSLQNTSFFFLAASMKTDNKRQHAQHETTGGRCCRMFECSTEKESSKSITTHPVKIPKREMHGLKPKLDSGSQAKARDTGGGSNDFLGHELEPDDDRLMEQLSRLQNEMWAISEDEMSPESHLRGVHVCTQRACGIGPSKPYVPNRTPVQSSEVEEEVFTPPKASEYRSKPGYGPTVKGKERAGTFPVRLMRTCTGTKSQSRSDML